MTGDDARNVVVAALAALAVLWVLSASWLRLSGTWERVLDDAEVVLGVRPERWVLGQLGPFVTGRRDVPGGHQEFSGIIVWRTALLTRRDHGVPSLVQAGFPEAIARLVDGDVTGKLSLRLYDGVFLEGTLRPRKIAFTHQPPRITGASFLAPQRRRYQRVKASRTRVPTRSPQTLSNTSEVPS